MHEMRDLRPLVPYARRRSRGSAPPVMSPAVRRATAGDFYVAVRLPVPTVDRIRDHSRARSLHEPALRERAQWSIREALAAMGITVHVGYAAKAFMVFHDSRQLGMPYA